MKKTLAAILVAVMVLSCVCVLFVSAADETNLAKGKSYTHSSLYRSAGKDEDDYPDEGNTTLTDGVKHPEDTAYTNPIWAGFNTNCEDFKEAGYAWITVDLGASYSLSEAVLVSGTAAFGAGIKSVKNVSVFLSDDGKTFGETADGTTVAVDSESAAYTEVKVSLNKSARYVQFRFDANSSWMFVSEVEVYGGAAEPVKTWKDTFRVEEKTDKDGNKTYEAVVDVPYGYVWNIDKFEGKITGEDSSIVATPSNGTGKGSNPTYADCNPNWAITLVLKDIGDGKYEAVCDAVVTPGPDADSVVTIGEGEVAVIIHSASSDPNQEAQYPNWEAKIVAISVKTGDQFKLEGVDFENKTVTDAKLTALIPGSEPVGPTIIKETIEIDGSYDDTGYEYAEPFTKGQWQGQTVDDPQPEIQAAYVVRSDDENVYLGILILNTKLEYKDDEYQVGATNYRIWMKGDELETRVFYDLTYCELDGAAPLKIYKNKEATDEVDAKVAEIGDDLFMEMKVAKESIGAVNGFGLMVTYSSPFIKDEDHPDGKYNAFHMTPVEGKMPDGWSGNDSAYQQYTFADIVLGEIVIEPEDPDDPDDGYEDEIKALVGDPNENAVYNVALSTEVEGKTVKATLTFKDLTKDAMAFICELHYDTERLVLKNESIDGAVQFDFTGVNWDIENDNLSSVKDGFISFQFGTTKSSQAVKAGNTVTVTFTFELKDGFEKAGLWIPNGSVKMMNSDFGNELGNGGYAIAEAKGEESSKEETSEPVKPGDSGIVVFALLGILAIAGAATVIKVRH